MCKTGITESLISFVAEVKFISTILCNSGVIYNNASYFISITGFGCKIVMSTLLSKYSF